MVRNVVLSPSAGHVWYCTLQPVTVLLLLLLFIGFWPIRITCDSICLSNIYITCDPGRDREGEGQEPQQGKVTQKGKFMVPSRAPVSYCEVVITFVFVSLCLQLHGHCS